MLAKMSEMNAIMGDDPNKNYSAAIPIVEAEMMGEMAGPSGGDPAAETVLREYRPESVKTQMSGDFEKAANGDMLSSTPLYKPGTKEVSGYKMTFKGIPGEQTFAVGDPRVRGGRMEKYIAEDGSTRFAGSETPLDTP